MPTTARFDPLAPEVESKDGGWVVLHYTGSGWILNHLATEDEARRHAKHMAERISVSCEFILVIPISEAYLPKR
jgi:hypothetical protein